MKKILFTILSCFLFIGICNAEITTYDRNTLENYGVNKKWVIDSYPEDEKLSSYKLSNYIIEEEYEDKILIIHTTTWAIYALSKEEYDDILNNEILKENKVIVPINLNEDEIAHNVYLKRMTPKNLPTFDKI